MNTEKILRNLQPLFDGFGIEISSLTPAYSYEIDINNEKTFLSCDKEGKAILATLMRYPDIRENCTRLWHILKDNAFTQPLPALIHCATGDGNIVLWCGFSLPDISSVALRALPARFIEQMYQTLHLLKQDGDRQQPPEQHRAVSARSRHHHQEQQLRRMIDKFQR